MTPGGKNNGVMYIAACFVFAAMYAFLAGRQPVVCRAVDGAIYGLMLLFAGVVLWNMFRYAVLPGDRLPYRTVFLFLLSIPVTTCMLSVETAVMYLCFPSRFDDFLPSLPLRIFITLLWFVIVRLSYVAYGTRPKADVAPAVDIPPPPQPVERITVRAGQKIKIIPLEDILYLQADGDYVAIHTREGRWLKEQTMIYTEEMLPPDRFLRIHRSYIVNLRQISRIERYGEQQAIILHNGEKIKVSAARYPLLKQRLDI
ncbi:MAG: LytTR family transcriptional regulator DNA-binding domain-containing protein [Tannerella sp.]|jgi:hypothetical protein|nr:LytTR family transcriptional regulator DNA-binding domain-containing protein [Tannerella sp.]